MQTQTSCEPLTAIPRVGAGVVLCGWREISTAPKDGSEMLGYREDAGVMIIRWMCADDFLTEKELEEWPEESAFKQDWFYADFVAGGRLEGDEEPTHWMPLPEPLNAKADASRQ